MPNFSLSMTFSSRSCKSFHHGQAKDIWQALKVHEILFIGATTTKSTKLLILCYKCFLIACLKIFSFHRGLDGCVFVYQLLNHLFKTITYCHYCHAESFSNSFGAQSKFCHFKPKKHVTIGCKCQGHRFGINLKTPERPWSIHIQENVNTVKQSLVQSPKHSAHEHDSALGLSYLTVKRILHYNLNFHSFKMMLVQKYKKHE